MSFVSVGDSSPIQSVSFRGGSGWVDGPASGLSPDCEVGRAGDVLVGRALYSSLCPSPMASRSRYTKSSTNGKGGLGDQHQSGRVSPAK